MSEANQPGRGTDSRSETWFLRVIYIGVAVQVLLYLYLFYYIGQHSNPKGDGMEWVAVMPATLIVIAGVGPALSFRKDRRPWIGAIISLIGVAVGIAFFLEIAREFAESAAL
jgi:hypothetical protein